MLNFKKGGICFTVNWEKTENTKISKTMENAIISEKTENAIISEKTDNKV